jgi:hypothetical protein
MWKTLSEMTSLWASLSHITVRADVQDLCDDATEMASLPSREWVEVLRRGSALVGAKLCQHQSRVAGRTLAGLEGSSHTV